MPETAPTAPQIRAQIVAFSAIALALSAIIAAIAYQLGDENITFLVVLSPSILAAILTAIYVGKAGLRDLFVHRLFKPIKLSWLLVSLLGIPAIAVLSLLLNPIFGGAGLKLSGAGLLPQAIVILLISIGEEFGWRGFLLPRLQTRYSALIASLILALIWGLWHFPGYLIGVGVPLGVPFAVFMLWVIPMTILMTWVYNNTQSILAAIIMHSAANVSFAYLFLLPEITGEIGSFYTLIALSWLAAGIVTFRYGPTRLQRS